MEEHIVTLTSIEPVTHDVKRFRFDKPADYNFVPGQATEVSVNKPGWKDEKRPFTFTSLQEDPYLEFTIKGYKDHHGVTEQLHQLSEGDQLIIRDVWGTIDYKGPGYFIAGGAGITPFIAILRRLHRDNKIEDNTLLFSNKTVRDIIYENEFKEMLGDRAHFILSKEPQKGYESGRIDKGYFENQKVDVNKHFYICGPDEMVKQISNILTEMGAKPDSVIFEK